VNRRGGLALGLLGLGACEGPLEIPDGQRCAVEGDRRACAHETLKLATGAGKRAVHFQVPLGEAPPEGWPVAVLFQGSLSPASGFWEARRDGAFGAWDQVGVVEALLGEGFAVVTPNAGSGGRGYWNTNVLPWTLAWSSSPDHALMKALLVAIDEGTFGDLDSERKVAGGISSGGYMTSRMALSYPGEFRALAIESASWATCGGPLCALPPELPKDHPPTLFLHGEADAIVSVATMRPYARALEEQATSVKVVTDPEVGHAWLPVAPVEVPAWFRAAVGE
jgi:poly(3-hydroxybutyrate) depolymerase